jgi:sulfatase maturation enzyme AslB (radical SAM superfamily)
MANQQIFCNTPWYEAHIYWDGSLGICCQESRKLSTDSKYNIKTMTLREWFNSPPVQQLRRSVLSDTPTDICQRCYHEEEISDTSRRIRSNQKSVIFHQSFDQSFEQSPGHHHFIDSGVTDTLPIDLHIDLGNYCNLACKMCWSGASTKIASQYVRWGHDDHRQYLGNDWTKDEIVWDRFLNEMLDIPKLKNIHFMGGETLLTARFEQFVDFMIAHDRFDLCFSFVTNGTTFNESLMNKLKQFVRVGIEVSIETITEHNDYVRQNTNTQLVLENISRYKKLCDDSKISITVRPAISALTIGYYHTLLKYCLDNQILINSLVVTTPDYLDARILPAEVKDNYVKHYQSLLSQLPNIDEFDASNPNNYVNSIRIQIEQVINILHQSAPDNRQQLLTNMVDICQKWDNEYKFDAVGLYPELEEIFKSNGY